MSNEIAIKTQAHSVADMERMAVAFAKSKLFGVTDPSQALSLLLMAQAEGLHPASAMRDFHVIQGKPSLKADSMLGRYQQAGGRVEWHDMTDTKVSATFTHAQAGSVRIDWDIERAQKAQLTKNPMWSKYPRQMLRSRVISEGVRTSYPAVIAGLYTPEEMADVAPTGTTTVVSETGAKVADVPVEKPATDEKAQRADLYAKIKSTGESIGWAKDDILAFAQATYATNDMGKLTIDQLTTMLGEMSNAGKENADDHQ